MTSPAQHIKHIVISTYGVETVFFELSFRILADRKVELTLTRIDYMPMSSRSVRSEIDRRTVDPEDATNAAVDLEYAAVEDLGAHAEKAWHDPDPFEAAVAQIMRENRDLLAAPAAIAAE